MSQLFARDGDQLLELKDILAKLAREQCNEALDAGAIRDWIHAQLKQSNRSASIGGSMLMGHFNHLQHLPCRVLVMLGMNAAFPRQNRTPSWDLLRNRPKIWDRRPGLDDRQQFLDALLTPTERLIISAPNRNVRTGKQEPFSSCVEELLRVLPPNAVNPIQHRLQPFAHNYFSPDPQQALSYQQTHAKIAHLLSKTPEQRQTIPFASPVAKVGTDEFSAMITSEDLASFWKNPAKAWAQALKIGLSLNTKSDWELDHQPMELSGLLKYQVSDNLLKTLLQKTNNPIVLDARSWTEFPQPLSRLKSLLEATRSLPPDNLGDSHWQEILDKSLSHAEQIQALLGTVQHMQVTVPDIGTISSSAMCSKEGSAWFFFSPGKFSFL
ncbi:MAG: exodeoxyribonuclease V subunit gamma [Verrucomicrobia bacterium]|nr:exodeoxyribonuclease V subunit gamma [Verrucomicrobiota bacterium]